jgi:hypothetical protein
MNASVEQRTRRHGRRWTRQTGRRLTVVGATIVGLVLATPAPIAASAQPSPDSYHQLRGYPWSGWHVRPPTSWAIWAAWSGVTCEAADGGWHHANVAIGCTVRGLGIGLTDPSDASFTLSTSVVPGVEDPGASTSSRTICNVLGNCTIVGPIAGIRVDRRAPVIVATVVPMEGPYAVGTLVQADFTCSDHGSGVRWCPPPTLLDTTRPGLHTMTFQAIDVAGNVTSTAVDYTVVGGPVAPMIALPDAAGRLV